MVFQKRKMTKSGSASITATTNTVVLGNGRADFKGKESSGNAPSKYRFKKKFFLYKNNVTPNIIKFVWAIHHYFILGKLHLGRICNKKVIFQINLMSFLFEQNHFAIEQMFNAKDVAPEILESHNGKIRLLKD